MLSFAMLSVVMLSVVAHNYAPVNHFKNYNDKAFDICSLIRDTVVRNGVKRQNNLFVFQSKM